MDMASNPRVSLVQNARRCGKCGECMVLVTAANDSGHFWHCEACDIVIYDAPDSDTPTPPFPDFGNVVSDEERLERASAGIFAEGAIYMMAAQSAETWSDVAAVLEHLQKAIDYMETVKGAALERERALVQP